jgi:hypothetical protein
LVGWPDPGKWSCQRKRSERCLAEPDGYSITNPVAESVSQGDQEARAKETGEEAREAQIYLE